MDFIFLYSNLIRILVIVSTVIQLFKRDYKKMTPAAVMTASTFVHEILGLLRIELNTVTEFLFVTLVFMGVYLGGGYNCYNLIPWWDRSIHFLSGMLFFSLGISLAGRLPVVGLTGTLVFSFILSLALHEIWEIIEFLVDSIFHSDHQHWQKHSAVVNHQPEKAIQPPGLVDTMIDTIAGLIGAVVACVGWWIFFTV